VLEIGNIQAIDILYRFYPRVSPDTHKMSLTKLHQDHLLKQHSVRASIDRLRRDATASLEPLAANLVDSVSLHVAHVFTNEQKIENLLQSTLKHVAELEKTVGAWISLASGIHDGLKELGDVTHWTQTIKRDLEQINATLEIAEGNEDLLTQFHQLVLKASKEDAIPVEDRQELENWLSSD
jgi:hypothetical protein